MLERLYNEMAENSLDWIILSGIRTNCPDIMYIAKGFTFAEPIIAIKRDGKPVFIHEMMESEEALQSQEQTICRDDIISRSSLISLPAGQRTGAFWNALIKKLGISGKVLFTGSEATGKAFMIYEEIKNHPEIEIAPFAASSILKTVREIKTEKEISFIQRTSKKIIRIFSETEKFISSCTEKDGFLYDSFANPAYLGSIRDIAKRIYSEEGLSKKEIPIISMGSDAASPHMRGNDSMRLETGKTIVMDISPADEETGYYSDMTRTFCINEASDRIRTLFRDVKDAYVKSSSLIKTGERLSIPDEAVCGLFEERGHKTSRTHPGTSEGYVHSLGHGVGLEVHEFPQLSSRNTQKTFKNETVFTIEPGLYYKSIEAGIRLEDTFYLDKHGKLINLTEYPMELIIKTK